MEHNLCTADELQQFQVPGHHLRRIFIRFSCLGGGAFDTSLNWCGSLVGGVLQPEWTALQRNVQGYINLPVPWVGHLSDRGQLLGATSANAYADACLDGDSNTHTNLYTAAIHEYADDHTHADSYRYTAAIRLNIRITLPIQNPVSMRGSDFV